MNKFLFFVSLVITMAFVSGCENDRTDYNNHNYNSGNDYYNYDDETYVSIEVRNDYPYFIEVYIGNALYDKVEPGYSRSVTRSLIGNEKIKITIWFYDEYGYPIAYSGEYSFDRDFTEYHMNVRGPGSIKCY